MKNSVNILFLVALLSSCISSERERSDFCDIDYDFELRGYYSDDLDNHISTKFFKDDKLVRLIGKEYGCEDFHYNSTGKILETIRGRRCKTGWRKIYIYDSLNNHIGYYSTMDSIVNLDTVNFEQIFFYNSDNRLIKERTERRNDIQGVEFEIWKLYTYSDTLIQTETILRNNDTVWIGEYSYNSNNELIKIHRTRANLYETELFKYNANGLLIEKEIISTENPITPETAFSAGNNKTKYKYDSDGILKEVTILNHRNEIQVKTIYKKIKNDPTTLAIMHSS